jgi:hypothetical protein
VEASVERKNVDLVYALLVFLYVPLSICPLRLSESVPHTSRESKECTIEK